MQWDSKPSFRADLLRTALPTGPLYPVVSARDFRVTEHAYTCSSEFGLSASYPTGQILNCCSDRAWDCAGNMGSVEFESQLWGGFAPTTRRLISGDVVIADSGLLALMSAYAPKVSDRTSISEYWPGTWPQVFPTGFSSGLVSEPGPPAFFSPFESLVQVDYSNAGNQTGKNLVRLYDARATLDAVEVAIGS